MSQSRSNAEWEQIAKERRESLAFIAQLKQKISVLLLIQELGWNL